jgi:heme-degrading monooxygenase HmoA
VARADAPLDPINVKDALLALESENTHAGVGEVTSRPGRIAMIARVWRGWTASKDAQAYADYIREVGLSAYRATPGNQGAWILQRNVGDRTEVLTVSLWESEDAVRRFAGDDITRAVFYPRDDAFLVDRSWTVDHYRVTE